MDCEGQTLDVCFDPEMVLPLYSFQYEVIVSDENGCLATDDINVNVERLKSHVYMPNAFSPNGDGVNDKLYVQSHISVAKIISFQIFDRWGTFIFSKSNFAPNDPTYGWDGVHNGFKRNPDNFVFQLEYELLDESRNTISGPNRGAL